MKITAAVARAANADFTIEPVELDDPRDDEVLVRIAGVGICHTDLIARDQHIPVPLPAVLGHEASGVVERVGARVRKVKAGDRVVLSFLSCGRCERCEHREPSYCHSFVALNFPGVRADGSSGMRIGEQQVSGRFFGQSSFATHALAHERNVVKVVDEVALELLGPLGCGFQTGAGAIMRSLACEAGSSVAIFGCGAVGIAAVMGAAIQRCKTIIVVEPQASRRKLALELGATHAIDPFHEDTAARIREIVAPGVHYAFDSTGIKPVIETALGALALHGALGVVAAATPDTSISLNLTAAVIGGWTIKAILEGDSDPDELIPELIRHYREQRFPLDRVIQTFPLARINEAVAAQHRGDCIKAVLIP
jgi:aryl-alcohol dehydrogenase